MADTLKDYTGKIVRVHYLAGGQENSKTGIVFNQVNKGENMDLTMFLTNGSTWQPPYKAEITKVTSVRMEEDLRNALKVLYEAKRQQKAFLESVKTQERMHAEAVSFALKAVKEASGEITISDFMQEAENLFRNRFPSSGGFHNNRYFHCSSASASEITLSQIQEVEKYADPKRYTFLYRRYDGSMTFTSEDNGFKKFCERCAPPIISALSGFAEISTDASVGDKAFLTASRDYTFALPYGCTKDSLRYLQDILDGKIKASVKEEKAPKKKSLAEQIQNADSKKKASSQRDKTKEPTR